MPNTKPQTVSPALFPATLLTLEDFAAVQTWQSLVRGQGVRVTISGDYPSLPDAGEVSWPWSDEVRWLVWRNVAGVWLEDLESQDLHGPGTVAEALTTVERAIEAERDQMVAGIPAVLGDTGGDLWGP